MSVRKGGAWTFIKGPMMLYFPNLVKYSAILKIQMKITATLFKIYQNDH